MINNDKTSFKDLVFAVVKNIPKGKVATYGQIARLVGCPKGARAVGTALSQNYNPDVYPCHRVVSQSGRLTGYSLGMGLATKKEMLIKEGIFFTDEIVDLSRSLWNGK